MEVQGTGVKVSDARRTAKTQSRTRDGLDSFGRIAQMVAEYEARRREAIEGPLKGMWGLDLVGFEGCLNGGGVRIGRWLSVSSRLGVLGRWVDSRRLSHENTALRSAEVPLLGRSGGGE
jgi:hypothetical protein